MPRLRRTGGKEQERSCASDQALTAFCLSQQVASASLREMKVRRSKSGDSDSARVLVTRLVSVRVMSPGYFEDRKCAEKIIYYGYPFMFDHV